MPIRTSTAHTGADDAATEWLERWDRQQEGYIPDRETLFALIADAVEAAAGRSGPSDGPVVLDLGCGPGSLSARLLDRFHALGWNGARVVGVDADPLLLYLARSAYGGSGLTFVDHDLRDAGWTAALDLDRQAHAVVSTTALHWLSADELGALYAQAAQLLRPGGVLINGDTMGAAAPQLAEVERELERRQAVRLGVQGREEWHAWWDAIEADPRLGGPVAERALRRSWHPEHEPITYAEHERLLRAAGFAEVDTLWQYGSRRVVAAAKA